MLGFILAMIYLSIGVFSAVRFQPFIAEKITDEVDAWGMSIIFFGFLWPFGIILRFAFKQRDKAIGKLS